MITVYGKPECTDWARSRAILDSAKIEYTFHDILADPSAASIAVEISGGTASPVIVFDDDSFLVEPSDPALTDKLRSEGIVS